MSTKLSLYKGCCLLLKERPIDALTDDVKVRYIIDTVYDRALAFALEQGDWNFGQRTIELDSSTDVEPEFGFGFVFAKPDDWVRTVAMSAVDTFWPPLGPDQFVDEGVYWHADCDPLYVSYVSDGVTYGGDLAVWSATFERYFEHELAERVGPHLTTMSEADMDRLEKRKIRALVNAKAKDARNQAAKSLPPGRLMQARGGGRGPTRWRATDG